MTLHNILEKDFSSEDMEIVRNLNNQLLNLWIKSYFRNYWRQSDISLKWTDDLLSDLEPHSEYLVYQESNFKHLKINFPYIREEKNLTNEECVSLWCLTEYYDGLRDYSYFSIAKHCNNNLTNTLKYIDSIRNENKFPDIILKWNN